MACGTTSMMGSAHWAQQFGRLNVFVSRGRHPLCRLLNGLRHLLKRLVNKQDLHYLSHSAANHRPVIQHAVKPLTVRRARAGASPRGHPPPPSHLHHSPSPERGRREVEEFEEGSRVPPPEVVAL